MTDPPNDHGERTDRTATRPAQVTYEIGEDERPSDAIVRATATLTDTPTIELEPLYTVIDPERLDGLFDESRGAPRAEAYTVTFDYSGCEVSLTPHAVRVQRREPSDD